MPFSQRCTDVRQQSNRFASSSWVRSRLSLMVRSSVGVTLVMSSFLSSSPKGVTIYVTECHISYPEITTSHGLKQGTLPPLLPQIDRTHPNPPLHQFEPMVEFTPHRPRRVRRRSLTTYARVVIAPWRRRDGDGPGRLTAPRKDTNFEPAVHLQCAHPDCRTTLTPDRKRRHGPPLLQSDRHGSESAIGLSESVVGIVGIRKRLADGRHGCHLSTYVMST